MDSRKMQMVRLSLWKWVSDVKILYIYGKQDTLPASKQVNRVGKYLYNHLDGAFKNVKSSNTYDVYVTLLYELKEEYGGIKNDVQEMTINISITTYQNKIRVNTIEMTPEERTLGFDLFPPEAMDDLLEGSKLILSKVRRRIEKAYQKYNILF